jgi:4-hydroxy-tetrahydrodipicolinate reductase
MDKIKLMVNGLPGNMAANIVNHALKDDRFSLVPHSLTGPEIFDASCQIKDTTFQLIRPEKREAQIQDIKNQAGFFITVDYTHPSGVNSNAEFYSAHGLPFVMGTTGGDRVALKQTVANASISAVIAPNMAKQIVGFQAMMEYAGQSFPDLFKGYSLEVKESHQKGKADTSGTAKAMIRYFNAMGVPFKADDIRMARDPEIQEREWGIPQEYLSGHGWHTYTLTSADQTVQFSFSHNVNGRDVYVNGTLDAVCFLQQQLTDGSQGTVYSMIDVLKSGK